MSDLLRRDSRATDAVRFPQRKNHRARAAVAAFLKYSSLVLAVVVVLIPLVAVFLTSFKTREE